MKFKDFLATKSISESDFQAMEPAEAAKLLNEYQEAVQTEMNKKLDGKVDASQLKVINDQIAAVKTANDELRTGTIQKLNDTITNMGLEITNLKEKQTPMEFATQRQAIKAAILEQKDKLIALKDERQGSVQLTFKAVADMTFATHTTGQVGRQEFQQGIVQDLRRTPILLELFDVGTSNANLYTWVEKTGREGGMAMTAEGATKPQGDFDLEAFSQKPKKEAIIITISKELLDDVDGMVTEVENEIRDAEKLFTDSIVLTGDGLGNNIEGMDANATAFAAGTFAGTVDNANAFDAIRVAINQVELNNDYPTAILMHPSDATANELIKDPTTSQYILPPFTTSLGTVIKGLPVRTSTVVTQGDAYVGNFRRFKVKIRENMTFEVGYRGAAGDWEKNFVSFLGEQRLFAFIPQNHYGSIVKVDLSVAIAALETP